MITDEIGYMVDYYTEIVLDINNSSEETLNANSTFTGNITDVSKYKKIIIKIKANASSGTGTLYVKKGDTKKNLLFYNSYVINNGNTIEILVYSHTKFVQLIYTNGNVNLTSFLLETLLIPNAIPNQFFYINNNNFISQSIATINSNILSPVVATNIAKHNIYSRCYIEKLICHNISEAAGYIKLYNKAEATSSDVPIHIIMVDANVDITTN